MKIICADRVSVGLSYDANIKLTEFSECISELRVFDPSCIDIFAI